MQSKRQMTAGWLRRISRWTAGLCMVAATVYSGHVFADTYTWSTGTTGAATDGSGTWNTSTANWVGAGDAHTAWNNANGDTAAFGAGGTAGTVTVDAGGITIGGLLFNAGVTGAYTLSGGPLTLVGSPVFQADAAATNASVLMGSAGFTKTGSGMLTLSSSASSFSGDVTVSQGTLAANSKQNISAPTNSALGYLLSPRTITVESGASLAFYSHDTFGNAGAMPLVTIDVKSGGSIRNSNTFNALGPVNLEGSAITSAGGANPTYQSYQFMDTVTSGGNAAIDTTGGTYNGVHVGNNLFAVTGGTLTVSAPLLNKYGNTTAGFAKSGGGTMVLAADNSFRGGVTVSNGVLQVGNGGASGTLGTGANAVSLVNADALLLYDRSGFVSQSGAISGDGSLVKVGSSVLTLSGANSYAGTTIVSNGILAVTITNALPGYASAGRVTLEPGTALSVGVGRWSDADMTALIGTGLYSTDTFFGFDTSAGNYTYNGQFTLPTVAGLVKTGPYALTINGGNTCAGGVTALSGILQADFGTGIPDTTNLTLSGASVSSASGSVTASLGTGAGEINLVSGTASGFSAVDVPLTVNVGGAGAALSWGGAEFNPSALVLNETGANTNLTLVNGINLNGATRTVNVNASGVGAAAEMSSVIANGSATAGLVKGGAGTLRLSAANTYSGGTTVNEGTLALTGGDNRLNTGANITLNGGTLDLDGGMQVMTAGTFGMANGAILQNGTLSYYREWEPGGSGNVTFAAGGRMTSPGRLIIRYGPTLTLASDAGATAFGGDGAGSCNFIAVDQNSSNTVTVSGGSLNLTNVASGAGYLRLGCNGSTTVKPTGVLNVSGGAVNVGHSMSMGARYDNGTAAAYGVGTLNLSGGEVNVGTGSGTATANGNRGWLYLGNNHASTVSKSTVNLNGGTLSLVRLEGCAFGENTVNFNGGTLKARADSSMLVNGAMLACNMCAGGVVIDTDGYNVGVGGNLSGLGSLTKQGTGTLVLSGSNTYSGVTAVEAGTLKLSALGSANLTLHLDASDVSSLYANSDGTGAITGTGQQVGYWGDLSGKAKPATQAIASRRPTYLTGVAEFNNMQVLQFDGSDDDITSLLDINVTNIPNITIMMICRQVSYKVNGGLWGHDNGSWDRIQLLNFGSVGNNNIAGNNNSIAVKGMNTNGVFVYAATLKNGVASGSYVYIDGVSDGNTGLPAFTSQENSPYGLTSFTVGNISPTANYRGNIQVGEVMVFDTVLCEASRRNVEAYMRNKWLGASDPMTPVLQSGVATQMDSGTLPGLKLRLDASETSSLFTNSDGTGGVTTPGQTVGTWGDLSGNNKPATQPTSGRRPTYVTDAEGFGGLPVLRFDGVDDDITSLLDINASSMPNITIMMVYRQVAKTANGGLWGHDNGGWDRLQLLNFTAGSLYDGYPIATTNNCTPVKGMNTNAVLLYTAVLKNGVANGSYVYINGLSDATCGLPAFTSQESSGLTSFTLGNISAGNGYRGNVEIGEVLVFDAALDDTARGNVEDYLRDKWLGGVPGGVELAAGAVLDLDGSEQEVTTVSGGGTVSNGTLTVTESLSPAGAGIGTLGVAGASLNGVLRVDVTTSGACDQLAATGDLSLTGLTLQVADLGLLSKAQSYTVVTSSGTLTGSFAANNLPDNWYVRYDTGAGTVTFYYAAPGTVITVR